jgi:hypothetical protein
MKDMPHPASKTAFRGDISRRKRLASRNVKLMKHEASFIIAARGWPVVAGFEVRVFLLTFVEATCSPPGTRHESVG